MHPHSTSYGHTRQASARPPSPPLPPGTRHASSHPHGRIRHASIRPPSPPLPPGTRLASARPPSPPRLPSTRHALAPPHPHSPYGSYDGDLQIAMESSLHHYDGDFQIAAESSPHHYDGGLQDVGIGASTGGLQDMGTDGSPGGFAHHHLQPFLPPVSRSASIRACSPSPSGAFLHTQPSNPAPVDSAPKKRKQITPSSGDEVEAGQFGEALEPLKIRQPLKAPRPLKRAQLLKTPRRPPPANPPQTRLRRSQAENPTIITTDATPAASASRRRPGLRQLQASRPGRR